MNKISSNSIRSSVDNPLNRAQPNENSPRQEYPYNHHDRRLSKSSYDNHNSHDHIFGGGREYESRSEAQFGKTRTFRAKLGEPVLDDEVLASREKYKRELDTQVADNQRQKMVQEIEYRRRMNANGAPDEAGYSSDTHFRHRNVGHMNASQENLLANPEQQLQNGQKATIKWQPRMKSKEDETAYLIEQIEKEKKQEARRRKQQLREDDSNFFDQFGKQSTKPTASLVQTDVTKEKLMNVEHRRADPNSYQAYYNDLRKQVDEKENNKRREKLENLQAEEQHTRQFNNYWQRQGGGAPTDNARRHNLMGNLISPRFQQQQQEDFEDFGQL